MFDGESGMGVGGVRVRWEVGEVIVGWGAGVGREWRSEDRGWRVGVEGCSES